MLKWLVGGMLALLVVTLLGVSFAPAPVAEDCIGGLHDRLTEMYAERTNGREKLLQIWGDKSTAMLKVRPDENLVLGCTAQASTSSNRRIELEYGVYIARGERFTFYRVKAVD
jgi:hypothetical protein